MGFPSQFVRKGDAKETKVAFLRNQGTMSGDYIIRVSGQAMRSWSQYHNFFLETFKVNLLPRRLL